MRLLFSLCLVGMLVQGMSTPVWAKEKVVILLSGDSDANDASLPLAPEVSRLLDYLASETEVEFEIQRYQWKRALLLAQAGKGLLYGASITAERKKTLKFSEAYYQEQVWLVTRCDQKFNFNQLEDLRAKTLGLIRDSTYGEELDKARDQVFKAEFDMNNSRGRFQKLLKQRIDAILVFSPSKDSGVVEKELNGLYASLAHAEVPAIKAQPFCVLPKPATQVSLHFAVAPGYFDQYFQKLDQALLKARESGKLASFAGVAKP